MINKMVKVNIIMLMVRIIKVIGKMDYSMVMEQCNFQMGIFMRVNGKIK